MNTFIMCKQYHIYTLTHVYTVTCGHIHKNHHQNDDPDGDYRKLYIIIWLLTYKRIVDIEASIRDLHCRYDNRPVTIREAIL